jgi:phage N-6-adenine-methyltransferase
MPVDRPIPPMFTSRTEEWTTPPHIIAVAERVLGAIDLDPCAEDACAVPAATHYTRGDDGLAGPWFGRVYMNPPYGKQIRAWVDKVATAYETGEIDAAVVLVHARTDTRWARRLAAYPRCYIYGRLRFGGSVNSAPFPSMLVYLGPDLAGFVRETAHLGDTYTKYQAPAE